MLTDDHHDILDCQIRHLELSMELKHAANAAGIKTMRQLLKYRTHEVERWPAFNIQLIHEYVQYLTKNGLGKLIDVY